MLEIERIFVPKFETVVQEGWKDYSEFFLLGPELSSMRVFVV